MINVNFSVLLSFSFTCLYEIQLVVGSIQPHAILTPGSLKEKEEKLLFLKKSVENREGEVIPNFRNLVCSKTSPDDKEKLCLLMTTLLKGLTVDEFMKQNVWADTLYLNEGCILRNIVFNALEEETLENLSMLYCSKNLFHYKEDGNDPVTTTSFYVMSGENEDEILLFLQVDFCKRPSLHQVKNSVRLWQHVKILYSENAFSQFTTLLDKNRKNSVEEEEEPETNVHNPKYEISEETECLLTPEKNTENDKIESEIVEIN